jgi:hypothetical protein
MFRIFQMRSPEAEATSERVVAGSAQIVEG